jgi:hypothetical protein
VKDVLSGITAGGWALLVGWIFPSAIGVALFAFWLFPSLHDLAIAQAIAGLSATERALVLAFLSAGLGLLLSALQTPLYRVLEGYLLPTAYRNRRIAKHREKKQRIAARVDNTKGLEHGLWLERQLRYPADDKQVAPTRLANAIRAFETYGFDRYQLDTQSLWSELTGVVPDTIRSEQERARAPVDLFVSLVYLSVILGIFSLVMGVVIGGDRLKLLVTAMVAFALVPAWYMLAVISTRQWYYSVQALVNVGRKPLAEALGLRLPASVAEERRMWERVNWAVKYAHRDYIAEMLDLYRVEFPAKDASVTGKLDGKAAEAMPAGAQQPANDVVANQREPSNVLDAGAVGSEIGSVQSQSRDAE